ncbi:hypothetical protein MASR2M36_02230 [Providencia sp.]
MVAGVAGIDKGAISQYKFGLLPTLNTIQATTGTTGSLQVIVLLWRCRN